MTSPQNAPSAATAPAAHLLVTGATGFIGRHIVDSLLARGARVSVVVRPATLAAAPLVVAAWRARGVDIVAADLTRPDALSAVNPGTLSGVVHAAALYDLGASDDALVAANVDSTAALLRWLEQGGFGGVLHHVSSVAVAGDFAGRFEERHFDEGQRHPHAYQRTKFESERLVRGSRLRFRIYRPAAVVGHSETGRADRVDGPYFYFKPIQRMARALPAWFPLFARTQTPFNMVPVDFVGEAIAALALSAQPDGSVYHLVDPAPPRFWEMINLFSAAANGPRLRNSRMLRTGMNMVATGIGELGGLRFYRQELLRDLGVPAAALDAMNGAVTYGADATVAALAPLGVACPPLERYAEAIWDFWARKLDPDKEPRAKAARTFAGKRVLVTGASSGIGAEVCRRLAELGADVVLVARRQAELDAVAAACVARGAPSAVAIAADLADPDAIDALVARVLGEVGPVDVLINNAGRSIRRPLVASAGRHHDFERLMQLNYFGPVRLTLGLLPSMRARGYGHVVNVLSAGTPIVPPRFGQYQASKAALNAFSDALAAEHLHEGIFTTSVYMPLVKTPMVDATDAYADQPGVMSVEEAAGLVLDGVVNRRRRVIDTETLRRSIWMMAAPSFMTRVLNVLYRLHPEEEGAYPELAPDRALLRRFMGNYRL